MARCRSSSSAPGNQGAEVEIRESLETFPSTLPTRRSAYAGWVSISVGCNNTCTFCIVPSLRGKETDRRPGDVLAEVQALVEQGVVEVTLLGQNVNTYGVEFGDRLAFGKLLRACGEIDGLERVRFTSPHPAAFTEDVILAMAETPNVMPSLHMPLQSGSDRVLKAMRRSYRSATVPRHHRQGPREPCRTRRSRPTSSSASRARPRRTSRRRSTWSARAVLQRVHLPVLDPARHAGRDAAGPGAQGGGPGPLRPAHRHPGGGHLGGNQKLEGARGRGPRRPGEGRKDAATHRLSGRARDNRLVHFSVPDGAETPRPGDVVTVGVTYGAPHHLVADSGPGGGACTGFAVLGAATPGGPAGARPGQAGRVARYAGGRATRSQSSGRLRPGLVDRPLVLPGDIPVRGLSAEVGGLAVLPQPRCGPNPPRAPPARARCRP